jgi:hypothetical protein
MTEHQEDLQELLTRLGTNPETGLDSAAVEEKFKEFGENILTPPATTPEWIKFLRELTGEGWSEVTAEAICNLSLSQSQCFILLF